MRLVFISSVTAITPLRTISVTTGSALALRGRFILVLDLLVLDLVDAICLFRLDIREGDHLRPLLDFVADKLGKFSLRHRFWLNTHCKKLGVQGRIGKPCIHFLVELVDDLARRPRGSTNAVPSARLITWHGFRKGRHVR